ncbi:MAG: ABC transporter ATP-binding protein [Bacteroidota bacterium]|nr:ABC transporter ATP-binding protein [Bacteroidota bacterium]
MIGDANILEVKGLTKTFTRTTSQGKKEPFYALNNLSFDLKKGQSLGIIGKNGSGKSTLLNILSNIIRPSDGEVLVRGKVLSILDIGTGMHPDLSGRENVFLRGELLGMSKQDIEKVYSDIVEFSEIGDFIDTPVKHYSSGMFLRLAFAIIVHLKADILLLDEVLSVGDLGFREKVKHALNAMSSETTLIIVSHEIHTIREFVDSILYLKSDKERSYVFSPKIDFPFDKFAADLSTIQSEEVRIYAAQDVILKNQKVDENDKGYLAQFTLEITSVSKEIYFGIQVFNDLDIPILTSVSQELKALEGTYCVEVSLEEGLFGYGQYAVQCGLMFQEKEGWKVLPLSTEKMTISYGNKGSESYPKEVFNGILQPTLDWTLTLTNPS